MGECRCSTGTGTKLILVGLHKGGVWWQRYYFSSLLIGLSLKKGLKSLQCIIVDPCHLSGKSSLGSAWLTVSNVAERSSGMRMDVFPSAINAMKAVPVLRGLNPDYATSRVLTSVRWSCSWSLASFSKFAQEQEVGQDSHWLKGDKDLPRDFRRGRLAILIANKRFWREKISFSLPQQLERVRWRFKFISHLLVRSG